MLHRPAAGPATNLEWFQTSELEAWSTRSGLAPEEQFLIDSFLQREAAALDAGTGSGRLVQELQRMGYGPLFGFDAVPELIERARVRCPQADFRVQRAESLDYPSCIFDQVLYLQQILCFIEQEAGRRAAVREAYRVLKPQGTAIFSFLSLEARQAGLLSKAFTTYLQALRYLTRRRRPPQVQPWLKRGGRPNLMALFDRPPYVYWFTLPETVRLLERAGFTVKHIASSSHLRAGYLPPPGSDLKVGRPDDKVYVVCGK